MSQPKLQHKDLSVVAASAARNNLPILLIVSQHYCPFCVRLKEEIIHPMLINSDYEQKAVITEILLDDPDEIRDFEGKPIKPGALATKYHVWVTPTLLFLDSTGRELHRRMLGVNTIEMYSYYLDTSLDAALEALRNGDYSYVASKEDIQGDAPGADQMH